MQMKKPGDAGHSTWYPDQGDWQGDGNIDDGSFWNDPLGAADSARKRFVTYGNWSGNDNKYDADIRRKMMADPSYDPAKDAAYGRGSAVDGLDAAAREHDLGYYRDNYDRATGQPLSMFDIDGLERTRNADRKLQEDAEREMAHPSIGADGKPINYSDDTRRYADGMQGFFGGRADGVDLRHDYMSGKKDVFDVAATAGGNIHTAYEKNGVFGAVCNGAGQANVAVASAYDWLVN